MTIVKAEVCVQTGVYFGLDHLVSEGDPLSHLMKYIYRSLTYHVWAGETDMIVITKEAQTRQIGETHDNCAFVWTGYVLGYF